MGPATTMVLDSYAQLHYLVCITMTDYTILKIPILESAFQQNGW